MKEVDVEEEVILETLDLLDLLAGQVRRDLLVCQVVKVIGACPEKLEILVKQGHLARRVPLVLLVKPDP